MKKEILNMIEKSTRPVKESEIFKQFSDKEKEDILSAIRELIGEGSIIEIRNKKYGIPEKIGLIKGTFRANERGFGFVTPEEGGEDYFVSKENQNTAWDGDIVFIKPLRNTAAVIEKIVQRINTTVVGKIRMRKNHAILVPDKKELRNNIFIEKENLNGVKNNQKAAVRITNFDTGYSNPEGEVIEILGFNNEMGVDVLSVIIQNNVPRIFPEAVIEESEGIEYELDLSSRRDLRDNIIFTIDGEDAKDFDDAVEIEKKGNGNYVLGVHIADVSNYVTPDSNLDKEALNRGNSYYFVDRVIPMLPEKLSNGVCSLRPDEEKLTFSCVMEIDNTGKIVDYDIFKSVIKSKARLTYTEVQGFLFEGKDSVKNKKVKNSLILMEELRKILSKKRKLRGGINFENPEFKVILDDKGKPVEIKQIKKWEAYNLIEEFMIAANETTAEHLYNLQINSIYRIHDLPDTEKLRELSKYVKAFGYNLRFSSNISSYTLQQFLDEVEGKPEEVLLNKLLLRTMKRASYSPRNIGHFGLASRCYTHFTSPIRRYADLIVHRVLSLVLEGKFYIFPPDKVVDKLKGVCKQCNTREQLADEVERTIKEMKILQYLKAHIGDEFEGIISGVKNFGIFIELIDFGIDGLIKLGDFEDDYYFVDEINHCIIGKNTNNRYTIGDTVKVKIVSIDEDRNHLDLKVLKQTDPSNK